MPEPKKDVEFEAKGNKEYKVETVIDSTMYGQQTNDNNQIQGLYYLVLWENYSEKENTWEPSLAIIYLRKLINPFYKEYPEKRIVTSLPLDSALSMTKPIVLKKPKQKCARPSKKANKRSRN